LNNNFPKLSRKEVHVFPLLLLIRGLASLDLLNNLLFSCLVSLWEKFICDFCN
jgi:hypothetical protein